jgi:hypothetical protein|tara:strand:+ start:28 stop:312 length:285 start_codon:yes stop_codon:yes gene_type:complete
MALSLHQQNTISKMNEQELIELNQFVVGRIKQERNNQARAMKRQLFIGSKVSFRDNDGRMAEGQVVKVMRKFAKIDTGDNIWRVPINLLNKVAA